MSIGDWLAIAAFAGSILGMVFALGKQAHVLQSVQENLRELAIRQREDQEICDRRLDKLSEFAVRVDQRISYVEERVFGDDTAARMRGMQ